MKKHNFYAGPSILSEYTIKNTADAVMNFNETGLSILEISHRSKEFQAVIDEANALIKELLEIPSGYEVLFLGGGASMISFCCCGKSRLRAFDFQPRDIIRILPIGTVRCDGYLHCLFCTLEFQFVRCYAQRVNLFSFVSGWSRLLSFVVVTTRSQQQSKSGANKCK